jgi:hypothetical protein
MITGQPASLLAVGLDVGDRLAVHGEHHPLAGPNGSDDLAGLSVCYRSVAWPPSEGSATCALNWGDPPLPADGN